MDGFRHQALDPKQFITKIVDEIAATHRFTRCPRCGLDLSQYCAPDGAPFPYRGEMLVCDACDIAWTIVLYSDTKEHLIRLWAYHNRTCKYVLLDGHDVHRSDGPGARNASCHESHTTVVSG